MVGEVVWVNQDELVERHLLKFPICAQQSLSGAFESQSPKNVKETICAVSAQCVFSVCAICAVSEQCVFSVQRYILFLPSSVQGQYPLPGSHTKKRNQKINWNIEWNMGANEFHPLLKWSIFVLSETGWIWFIGDILTYQTFFNGRPFLWSLRQPAFISDPPT